MEIGGRGTWYLIVRTVSRPITRLPPRVRTAWPFGSVWSTSGYPSPESGERCSLHLPATVFSKSNLTTGTMQRLRETPHSLDGVLALSIFLPSNGCVKPL